MIGTKVTHKLYGLGKVSAQYSDRITVDFGDKKYNFMYPDAFAQFLIAENPNTQKELLEAIEAKKVEFAAARAEDEKMRVAYVPTKAAPAKRSVASRAKPPVHKNLIFKCNYCDGGATPERLGYADICSKETMVYNVQTVKRAWCSNDDCACNKYLKGEGSYDDIRAQFGRITSVCYETQMLINWTAYMGWNSTGDRPYKLPEAARTNSLAVLSTLEPRAKEAERIIFAVFLVDYHEEGGSNSEGLVQAHPKYRISLSSDEAHQMLLWNYYSNTNSPQRTVWASGLTRLLDDENAAVLLSDIAKLKRGTKDDPLAQELFEHFCELNGIDTNALPEANGALRLFN